MDAVVGLQRLGGVARRNDLLAQGVSGTALRRAAEAGLVTRPVRGTYSLPGTAREKVTAAALRGQLACLSACAAWQIEMVNKPDTPHILVPADRHPQDERLTRVLVNGVHRDDGFAPGRRVQPVDLAVDHVALCTSPLEQLGIIDSARFKRKIDPLYGAELTLGSVHRIAWLLKHSTGKCQSVAESTAYALLCAGGFAPRLQVSVTRVGRVDFAVGAKHIVEVDGFEEHKKWPKFTDDRRRDREITASRRWCIRYTFWDVMEDPAWFVHDVARVVGKPVDARFAARLAWMMTVPEGHLNLGGSGLLRLPSAK